jgi:hypothetical protein
MDIRFVRTLSKVLVAFGRSTAIALSTLAVRGVLAWRSFENFDSRWLSVVIVAFGGFSLLLRRWPPSNSKSR